MSLKQRIIIPSALAVLLIIILGFTVFRTEYSYTLSTDEMLDKAIEYNDVVKPEEAEKYNKQPDKYRFIDLRTPHEFIKGHIEGAVNIPVHQLLSDENQAVLNSKEVINILYHSDHVGACSPWMLLKQIGYENNKILLGGYKYYKANIIENENNEADTYLDEKPKYDFAGEIQEMKGGADSISTEMNNTPPPPPPVKRKKTKTASGGC